MNKINFENLPSTNTPLSAENLNLLQDNVEEGIQEGVSGDLVVNSIRTKNMFNENNVIKGYVIGTNGSLTANADYCYSEYISVKPNTQYTISRTFNNITGAEDIMRIAYYGNDKSFIDRPNSQDRPWTITTPNNCYYVRSSYQFRYQSDENITNTNIQLEEGDTATTYKQYQDLNYKAPVVLYDNPSGTQAASITLSDYIGNYEYIELFYRNPWIYGSQKVFVNKSNAGKSFPLNIIYGSGTADITFMVNVYTVINNSLTMTESGDRAMSGTIKNNNIVSLSKSNQIWLMRVVGYK